MLREALKKQIVIADGAMGTMLQKLTIHRCTEYISILQPKTVKDIHKQYLDAGAMLHQTNTYGANRIKLARYGLEHLIEEINVQSVNLLKEVVGDNCYKMGTIGGIREVHKSQISLTESLEALEEQADILLTTNIDGLIFETFYDFEELLELVKIVRKKTTKPIIAHTTLIDTDVLPSGMKITDAFKLLDEAGADIVGLNCHLGPHHMLKAFKNVPLEYKAFLSVFPNASLPKFVDGQFEYETNAEYFASMGPLFRNEGIRLIGGCCGTTPAHILELTKKMKEYLPLENKIVNIKITENKKELKKESLIELPITLAEQAKTNRTIIAELDPPRKLVSDVFFKGARELYNCGIHSVTLADNSLANPRISNLACGAIIKQKYNKSPLIHLTCRDRNLIGLQSHLMGLHTLGLNEVLALTGDPSKVGDFPGASSVYDLSSFELIRLMRGFNEGYSQSGQPLGEKTNFSIGAAFNPNVRHLDKAVIRLEKKIDCGAHYFLTQPVYSHEGIKNLYEATKHVNTPIFIGIMPLTSYRNALFLHNEVPGVTLPQEVLYRMSLTEHDVALGRQQGLEITKELVETARKYFNGIYFITPFLRYDLTIELTKHLQKLDEFEKVRNFS